MRRLLFQKSWALCLLATTRAWCRGVCPLELKCEVEECKRVQLRTQVNNEVEHSNSAQPELEDKLISVLIWVTPTVLEFHRSL